MSWFTEQRQEWIAETVRVFGYINREHIVRKFGVSVPAASGDLKVFQKRNPAAITYNSTTKRYEEPKPNAAELAKELLDT